MPTVIIQACRLRQTAFKDLDEGEIGKWLVSFVAVPDAYSAISIAKRLLPTPGPPPSMTSAPWPLSARSIASRIA